MGLEKKGTQFRIRVEPPKRFDKDSFITLDVGKKGGLQLIRARRKTTGKFATQSVRVAAKDFKRKGNKLIPKTPRGKRQRTALKKRKSGRIAGTIRTYF